MPSDVTDQKLLRPQNSMTSHPPPKITDSLPCPRCDSTSTKFCYYNNYNLSQPRHFCKACRRYWTQGGTLRNVPVGGGTRKNSKRIRSCSSSAAAPASSSSSSTVTHEPLPISANPALLFPSGNPEIVSVSTTDVNMNENVPGPGNFTAILNNMQAQNFLGLGGFSGYSMGSDFEELELGFGGPRGWEIPGADYAGVNGTSSVSGVVVAPAGDAASSGCNTWQMVSSEEGGNDGLVNEDCFVWSGLAISTPGQGLK